jgi:hypothetical protein
MWTQIKLGSVGHVIHLFNSSSFSFASSAGLLYFIKKLNYSSFPEAKQQPILKIIFPIAETRTLIALVRCLTTHRHELRQVRTIK